MTYSAIWLPDVLQAAGLKVAEVPGWRTRGRGEMGRLRGVMCHHTGTPASVKGNMPTLNVVTDGRSDLQGPLAQLALGRDGTFYIVAAGRANHAGLGKWQGISSGNASFIGIEAENSGAHDDPWPAKQLEAYQHGVAAILKKIGVPSQMCCGHKEYAPHRKPDPSFNMEEFRARVDRLMASGEQPEQIPAEDLAKNPTLRRGSRHPKVKEVQEKVGVMADGIFGAYTEAAVRAFQRDHDLVPDGIVGPKTWAALMPQP